MPETIDSYNSQQLIKNSRQKARLIWGLVTAFWLGWIVLIVSAPLARGAGFVRFADSVYAFFGYLCHQISERSFHLHELPFAVCSRCFGFYFGFLLGLGVYPLFRPLETIEPLPRFWLFLAMVPIGIDWSLGFFEIWENTHASRSLTGAILGLACAVFIVPALAEMSRFFVDRKLKKAVARQPL